MVASVRRNYLRIRGEEPDLLRYFQPNSELPPHTRRRARRAAKEHLATGITSAYAEKSPDRCLPGGCRRNYLRIRGEEPAFAENGSTDWELPPHTRRRDLAASSAWSLTGITSAYAEKSDRCAFDYNRQRNYLRIRGEEFVLTPMRSIGGELPPHTRRRESIGGSAWRLIRITSAYAEKSFW